MPTSVENKLNYKFDNSDLMNDALRAAHRSEQDGTSYDGNRGLAHYGILAIQIAVTHNSIVEKKNTLHDLNTQDHWAKTKKGRAKACSSLGIEASIDQSVRQGSQRPSDTVLDNALSALLGAIWLDCEGQGQSTAMTRRTIWGVLRSIVAALSSAASSPACETGILTSRASPKGTIVHELDTQIGAIGLLAEREERPMERCMEEWFLREIGDMHNTSNAVPDVLRESETYVDGFEDILLGEDLIRSDCTQIASPPSTYGHTVGARSKFRPQQQLWMQSERQTTNQGDVSTLDLTIAHHDAEISNAGAKRKRTWSRKDKADSPYQDLLDAESQKLTCGPESKVMELERFLKHPRLDEWDGKTSNVFHFLWLAIGSWQTISNFKDQLQLARIGPRGYKPADTSTWGAVETYSEICRLENEESLNILLLRHYAIQLCKEEPGTDGPHGYIMVETPSTISAGGISTPGNPNVIKKRIRTDELVSKIMPTLPHNSPKFKKVRKKVKLLQKLALHLDVFVDSYGLGILALLPSGASFAELSLSNRMLTTMNETIFRDFAACLQEEQGSLLDSLSRALEPAVQALLTYSLDDSTQYPVECIDLSVLMSQPKGLLHFGWDLLLSKHTL